jgi:hypothetical protein
MGGGLSSNSSMQRPKPGFATIKTTQAIVTEEQTQREQQDYFEFQNLKRQHAKLLKAVKYYFLLKFIKILHVKSKSIV